jgi:bifunctional DNase/RNase
MIPVRIAGLSLDPNSQQPVLLLAPLEAPEDDEPRRVLPIWIGHVEASAIILAIQGINPPRPMTHDLLKAMVEVTGHIVARVEVTRIEDGTFYAAIVLRAEDRMVVVDARPSDSIALAVRTGAPLFVDEGVFEEAAVEVTEVDEEAEVERFRDFLDHVDPSDFMS